MSKPPVSIAVSTVQKHCLERNIPFFSYRLPEETAVCFGAQTISAVEQFSRLSTSDHQRFVFAPFSATNRFPAFYLSGDIWFKSQLTSQFDWDRLQIIFPEQSLPDPLCEMESQSQYIARVASVVNQLQAGEAEKIVLSRIITLPVQGKADAPLFFDRLQQAYPSAFVFLVSVPGYGLWAGATPEMFLSKQVDTLTCMSLAGTQRVSDDKTIDEIKWEQKEYNEQEFVSRYIRDCFTSSGIALYTETKPVTRQAAQVYHLCSLFNCSAQLPDSTINLLISNLHPTPAIGGVSKERAIAMINASEERRYYGGFLGPVINDSFHLFVNLRSMELFSDCAQLHVGGGITSQSVAVAEWDETCIKAQTLLNILVNENR